MSFIRNLTNLVVDGVEETLDFIIYVVIVQATVILTRRTLLEQVNSSTQAMMVIFQH